MKFNEFSLEQRLLAGISSAGYEDCTQVQEKVISASKNGEDLYVQSQTGTGKTAAYLISIINEMISKEENKGKKLLVLVPTRELAVQVEEESKILNSQTGLKSYSFYGGVGYEKQISFIKKGIDIIIGTPGRIIDLQENNNLDLSTCSFCVIDEADRMFDMGFYPDLRKILKCLPETQNRQTMLFSATLNSYVKNLAWEYTRDTIEITIEAENITVSEIKQELLHVSSDEKMKLLIGILRHEKPSSVIIFCNTKRSCEVISKRLKINEFESEFLIGDLPQKKRLQIINSFKKQEINLLVATDVAARGLDIDNLAMVINYDLPVEAENYVHRIGRTARAGKSGIAYTFCSEQDVYNLPAIERYIEMQIPSTVAYPELMEEDKSSGIYIKTENWHDDDKLEYNYKNKKNDFNKNRDYQNKNNKSYKDKYKKDYNNAKKIKKESSISINELANLSYEERMKVYKEKYFKETPKKQDFNQKNHTEYKKQNDSKKKKYMNNNYKQNNYKKGYYKKSSNEKQKKSFLQKLKELFKK